jgi:DNA-binding CsgD family transcriptional regulator
MPQVGQLYTNDGSSDLVLRLANAAQLAGPDEVASVCRDAPGAIHVGSLKDSRQQHPRFFEAYRSALGCDDMLAVQAHDPDGHGPVFYAPSANPVSITPRVRKSWERVAAHMAAAHRLRRNILEFELTGTALDGVPLRAEALLDPRRFKVAHAVGKARGSEVTATLREAALRVDRARGKLRREDPEAALAIWRATVDGRWTLLDWFDTDGRRYILAKANPLSVTDPRGLTEKEQQVVAHACSGESNKLIAYCMGLTVQRVSQLTRSAMRKLRVRTKAELIARLRGLGVS